MGKRTDLALEAQELWREGAAETTKLPGVRARTERWEGQSVTRVEILDPRGAEALGKPVGTYLTLDLTAYCQREEGFFPRAVEGLGQLLRDLLPEEGSVLVVGLGNAAMTADAVGPLAMSHILVTRHMLRSMPEEFRGFSSVAALTTGVLAETGLETSELVAAVAEWIKPRCVIVLDALAARSRERLCAVLQLTDTGLTPGSGVGNHRKAITAETLGVPVLALGLPTVIRAEQLAGEETPAKGEPLFVTPRDIDQRVRELSRMMAYGVDLALQPHLTVEDVTGLLG